MKVLHINCNYIGTALHRVMFRLLDRSGEHRVFVPSDGREAWKDFVPAEHETVAECFTPADRYLFFLKQKKIISALEKAYDPRAFGLIHAYTLFTDGNCAMKLSEKYGIPYVVAVRNTDLNGFFKWRKLLHFRGIRILDKASAVFFLSEEYRRQLLERYIPKNRWDGILRKSYIIPNGIDPFWLDNPAPPKPEEDLRRIEYGSLRLLCAGRIDRYKNQTRTAEAVELLTERGYDVRYTVVGNIREPQVFEKLRGCANLTYIEAQPREKLLELYRQSDIYVMPSTDETFGLVYPEAMSQGLPVIYSVGEGFYGQLPEGEAGYAADPRDTEDVAEKILLAVKNYREISRRCPELAKRFDWNAIVRRYEDIYRRVTGAPADGSETRA